MSNEVLAIVYDLWISGTQMGLDKKACINSIDIKETVEGSDVATIVITDPDFLYIEDDIFIEENTIKIKLGWDNTTYRVEFEGYISAIDIEFESTGVPKLTLTCMDNTHKMNRKKKDATYSNCTSADVVKKIVQSYGYTCVVDDTYTFQVQETITQSKQTDIDFITQLAGNEVHPFTARLVGNTFYYVKMGKLETPKMTLTYRNYPHEVISFSPRINKETKQVEITGASINTSNKELSTAKGEVKPEDGSSSNKGSSSNTYTYTESGNWNKNVKG